MGEKQKEHAACYADRGRDIDTIFGAVRFYDGGLAAGLCHRAIVNTTMRFNPEFPGWALYRRLVTGDSLLDRQLEAFAIGGARALARATKRNGRAYVSRAARIKPGWIAQAGRDALDYALFGRYAEGLNKRAERYGVAEQTYQAIRDPLADGLFIAAETWREELHRQFRILAARANIHDPESL